MSRYQNLMTEVLNAIFEGYTVDNGGKLKVVNESAAKDASEKLHTLVLEKSRDLWDQLEAAEDSLSGVAEEIRFEELNADPSSMATSVTHDPADEATAAANAAPAAAPGAEEVPATLESILGADDFDLNGIFEHGHDHLDSVHNQKGDGHMPFNEMPGHDEMSYEDEGGDVEDGDEDYDDLMVGMDDEGMGSPDASDGMDDMDYENGDDGMNGDGMNGDEMGDELPGDDMNGDDDMGFDFDLDLDGYDSDEDEMEGMGHHDKSYRMESDDKDDDKPAFLKGKDDDDKDDDKDDKDDKDDDKDDEDKD